MGLDAITKTGSTLVTMYDKHFTPDHPEATKTTQYVAQYFKKQSDFEFWINTSGIVTLSTLGGAAAGAAIGAIKGPPGALSGLFIGSLCGFGVGCALSAAKNARDFHKWLKQVKETEVFQEFVKFYEDNPYLRDFECPVKADLTYDPVQSPRGHIYDRSAIDELFAQSEREGRIDAETKKVYIVDPMTRDKLYRKDYVPCPKRLGEMKATFAIFLEREAETQQLSDEARKGLEFLVSDLTKEVAK